MSEGERKEAERRLEEALESSGARDPREFYRDMLRRLKADSIPNYQRAVAYYDAVLVPGIASGSEDPLVAWLEYGRTLAELTAPGHTVDVDRSGLSRPHEPGDSRDQLVLHIPDARNRRAILVGLPADLSGAQRATFDFLVRGKQRLPAELAT